ncbi:MAG: hypothetical protein KAQ65_02210 [Candidatus Thorarchaeota archaeon]|nr:hypothetical protein [Candidatus Thorarchaeota archaeon]MCK5239974.1 hypothetical protein [Candidatus Thorarchaeota archaeon]
MYRIYKCNKCNYSGIVEVSNEDEISSCGFCHNIIRHDDNFLYSHDDEEAEVLLIQFISQSQLKKKKHTVVRGIGIKRRLILIIESIIENNRGHPAKWQQVMSECSDAGIDPDRASHFVDVLKREGVLTEQGGGLVMNGEGVVT